MNTTNFPGANKRTKNRDERQHMVVNWAAETFGMASLTVEERVKRLIEEAVELAQAERLPRETVLAIVDHVYGKPAGEPAQEAGGLGVTLLAYCAVRGFSADMEEAREFERVLTIDPEYFRQRHNRKAAAGIAEHTSGAKVVHLGVHQNHACERCGAPLRPETVWTTDEAEYNNLSAGFVRCEDARQSVQEVVAP